MKEKFAFAFAVNEPWNWVEESPMIFFTHGVKNSNFNGKCKRTLPPVGGACVVTLVPTRWHLLSSNFTAKIASVQF